MIVLRTASRLGLLVCDVCVFVEVVIFNKDKRTFMAHCSF